ncbi:MAG TPA: 30S ribosomal protein S2, partial [Gaiellaceae bacterium]
MSVVTMRELLEAGVHFGHQTRRWNPKMRRYIFGERGGIYLIDLTKTQELLIEAHEFARAIAERNGTILFVGTKKQAQNAVTQHASRVGMPYVANRWLGGLLTNWRTISERIAYLHDLRRLKADGQLALLPSKERIGMEADLEKLEANLGGVADMKRQPDAVLVIDMKKELLAVRETHRLGVPVIGLVDTNADPDEAEFVIPGNDDAIRSCDLVARVIADGIAAGRSKVTTAEMSAPAVAESVAENATRVGMPYVSNRWLGGLLTNWRTISERIAYLHDLRRLKADGQLDLLPSKERIGMEADLEKLEANLGGVSDMKRQPDAVFVVDLKKELLAVRETHRLGVPVIGLVDTNADP